MCRYIFVVLPKELSLQRLSLLFTGFGRRLGPDPSLDLLPSVPGARSCFTSPRHCDCSTALGWGFVDDTVPFKPSPRKLREWRRRGWSQAKIDRALADSRAARERRNARERAETRQDLERWYRLIHAVLEEGGAPWIGLYVKDIESDHVPPPARRRRRPVAEMSTDWLSRLEEGTLYLIESG